MTAEEFAAWRKLMKVSKTKAAEMIGVSRNMPAKYEAGTVEVPLVVALACAALARGIAPWPR
jgi:predicted transcriptional regulator